MASDQQHPAPGVPSEIDDDAIVEIAVRAGVPEQYHQFDRKSKLAIEAALAARRPLLVRGEPGVGKTQLAAAAARALGRPLVQKVVEARTESRDLLWEYDAVMRLAEAQVAGAVGSIVLRQLEEDRAAITTTPTRQSLIEGLRTDLDTARFVRPGPLWWAFNWEDAVRQSAISRSPQPKLPPWAKPSNGCVVLIDEIDKAEADLPNGLLEALGGYEFTPLGRDEPVQVQVQFPLVIITTNEERALPNAFVRRCLVLHLNLPEREDELIKFLVGRARVHFPREAASDKSIKLFQRVAKDVVKDRQDALDRGITPLPGQAEYLDLIRALLKMAASPDEQSRLIDELKDFVLQKNENPGK